MLRHFESDGTPAGKLGSKVRAAPSRIIAG